MSNKPLILSENLFENVVLHPTFTVQVSDTGVPPTIFDSIAGHEGFRVADNLRDLTYSTVAASNTDRVWLVDCTTPVTPNIIILDRGHNLKGAAVTFGGSNDLALGGGSNLFTATIPATAGGLGSDANGCLTPDGVWWKTFSPQSKRVPYFVTPPLGVGIAPIVTGLYLGTYYRFPEFLNAPAAYDYGAQIKYMRNDLSRGGVRSKSRPINFDRLPLSIDLDSADYTGFDAEARRLLRYNQPWWFCLDDSDATGSGLMRMFQSAGDFNYDPQVNPVHRQIKLELEEVIPSLYA